MHLLIANVGHMGRLAWMRRWERDNGFARILPYDPAKGAAFYVAKYVRKQLGDYELSDNLDAFRVQQSVLKLVGQRVDALPGVIRDSSWIATSSQTVRKSPATRQLSLSDFKTPAIDAFDPDPIRASFNEQTNLRRR